MNQSFQEIEAIRQQMEACKGWQIWRKQRRLDDSYYVFIVNHKELKTALLVFNIPDVAVDLWMVENRAKLEQYLKEIKRLLHNYLAAVRSLVDHTRKLVCEMYKDTDFWEEYHQEVKKRFDEPPHSRFVQELRHYVLHNELPFVGATLRWEQNLGMENFVQLDVLRLRAWGRWGAKAREYLATLPEKVRLEEIIDPYTSTVVEFYKWFGRRQSELHHADLEELGQLQERLQRAITEARKHFPEDNYSP
ncbi:MAG: hypothetical protein DRI26_07320 [Chloroflexi bacterium]|nr:MAG: hypothetical protein DRI26_07320 [Chloroflexota bacterium]